uniref:OTU domain-containing protein n=1 Tax=Lactuca sativa TaxID=4236 RepID=A0A9R1WH04_LACSA|nr:hypothetical protein LSAT_V11C200096230 [Lactuca sativa]
MNEFPKVLHPYIKQVYDVEGDGHCGFRAIVYCLRLHKDEWYKIRVNLMEELETHTTEYGDIAAFSDTCVLIASRYNVVLHCFSRHTNTTHLSLWSTPPPTHECIAIAIVLVYARARRRVPDAVMPPITPQWIQRRRPCVVECVTQYIERLHMYNHYYHSSFHG